MNPRELNTEEKLLDFIAFILADFSELLQGVNYFFWDEYSEEVLKGFNTSKDTNIYKFYLKETIDLDSIKNTFKLNDLFNFSEQNKKDLISFINENYRHGFPDDCEDGCAYGGNLKIDLDISQFNLYLEDYRSLNEINNSVFISYFKYLLQDFEYSITEYLKKEYNQIKKLHYNSKLIKPEVKLDFIEHHKNIYKSNYIKSFNGNYLFFEINKDENDNFNINFKNSLIKQITKIKELETTIVYTKDYTGFESDLNEFKYELFLFVFENKPLIKNLSVINEIYESILNEKSEFISFLRDKDFNNNDINVILNILSNNSLAELGFKFLKRLSLNQVEIFRLLYFFYVFDFYKEKRSNNLKKIKDFEEVINFQSLNKNINKEQFRKYFNYIAQKNAKHYPFNNSNETLKLLEGILENDKLLKKQPDSKNLKFY